MIFYKFTFIYILSKSEARAKAKIQVLKVAKIGIVMLLPLLRVFLAILFLLARVNLWQIHDLIFFLKVDYKTFIFFLNKLVNLLSLKLLEL